MDITVNQSHQTMCWPTSKLSVVVPLNGSDVQIMMVSPSGATQEAYRGELNAGTYRFELTDAEAGEHIVNILMDGVLMESQSVRFE